MQLNRNVSKDENFEMHGRLLLFLAFDAVFVFLLTIFTISSALFFYYLYYFYCPFYCSSENGQVFQFSKNFFSVQLSLKPLIH